MSSEDANYKETLREVIGGNNDTTNSSKGETENRTSTKETNLETSSGETKEYVSGIDITDVPEQDRPRIKEKLSLKAKLLEDGYNKKFQEVAQLKKAQENLEKMGLTSDEAYEVLVKHIEQKKNPVTSTNQKKEAMQTLDRLMEESTPENRQALEQMRTIILEVTDVAKVKKKLEELEKILSGVNYNVIDVKRKEVITQINDLKTKYGDELVEKYRNVLEEKSLQHNLHPRKVLHYEVPEDELEEAILLRGKKPLTTEKKNANSSVGSGVTGTEKIDIKTNSIRDILAAAAKLKR